MLLTWFGRNVHRRRRNAAAPNTDDNERTFRVYEERQIEINELNQFLRN